jgi:glycosyltransferase involved in cell wall biosynthesis
MTELVSIVIPTYNHAHFLARSLRSVLDQTYPRWEAIVIDNHSKDNTDEVVEGFADERIRLLKIHNNGVIAASRNLGIREAAGKWVAFLDSDDFWFPRKLEVVMAAVSQDDVDVLCHNEMLVDTRTGARKLLRYGPYRNNFYRDLLLQGNRFSPSATTVRREFLVRHELSFDEQPAYATVEDFALWLNLARLGARFRFIPEVLGEYVIHGTNTSVRLAAHLSNAETLLRNHVLEIQEFEPARQRLWTQVNARLRLEEAAQLAIHGKVGGALKLAVPAMLQSPGSAARYTLSRFRRLLAR